MAHQWVKLELDAAAFDAGRFEEYVTKCRAEGIRLTTLFDLGDTEVNRRALYELNKECSADIPERGEFFSYEEFTARRFEVPSYDPRGVVIALDGDDWIGLAATSNHGEFVFNEMTGVRAAYRGRGISIAMKTFAMAYVRRCGAQRVRTFHHPANASAIGMNRTMGFVDSE
ncbi:MULTISPECIES: GNAT family N-acetyltransferase [unclassified Streptomyces]|uniref:GNAT family N-acetyltransferase n=1 Tax=unclassified Streptomyces TaxID=2593676 RepID=UPI0020348A95|nr:GNAT family N-acetyltransferase [Streptomyces sp. RKAG290]MCM2415922.1 GNAT family N-acetyltransferase [Streptomyces sp. RKAG290]